MYRVSKRPFIRFFRVKVNVAGAVVCHPSIKQITQNLPIMNHYGAIQNKSRRKQSSIRII